MPEFLPFAGIRYDQAVLGSGLDPVTAPPYDVIDDDARAGLEASDPHNAVQLILPRDDTDGDRYERAAATFARWLADGTLRRDPVRFYRYTMRFTDEDGEPRHTIGVLGALELSPPGEGSVLPHERTMPKTKSDRLDLLRAVKANLDPVWGLSLAPITHLLDDGGAVLGRCTDHEGVEHEISAIDDPAAQQAISEAVAGHRLVIADGHHRYETALAYRAERIAAGAGPGEYERIFALVVELVEEELSVRPIHRLIRNLPPGADLRAVLSDAFVVADAGPNTPEGVDALRVRMRTEQGLGLADHLGLALLVPRSSVLDGRRATVAAVVRDVDATVCALGVLEAFPDATVTYRNDAQTVASLVAKGDHDAAVLLKPVTVSQIHDAALAGERMPEKSTFFAPKPRTGLVFRSVE